MFTPKEANFAPGRLVAWRGVKFLRKSGASPWPGQQLLNPGKVDSLVGEDSAAYLNFPDKFRYSGWNQMPTDSAKDGASSNLYFPMVPF